MMGMISLFKQTVKEVRGSCACLFDKINIQYLYYEQYMIIFNKLPPNVRGDVE
jgi:hypothetical protein